MKIHIKLPYNIKGLNADKYSHWGKRSTVVKKQRCATAVAVSNHRVLGNIIVSPVYYIRLIRFGRKLLDTDNLIGGFKAFRDGICDALDINDANTERLKWSCEQIVPIRKPSIGIYIYDNIREWEMDKKSTGMAE